MSVVAKRKPVDPAFGRRLRKLREDQGWTLKELAERAEMPYQNIARLERGEGEPTYSTMLQLADALEVTLDEFREKTGGDGD